MTNSINQAIRNAGVIWQPCSVCGIDWPFPKANINLDREFICAVCCEAEVARIKRGTSSGT
jgi:hypothetical protein